MRRHLWLVVVLVATGCATPGSSFFRPNLRAISVGMTEQEVISRLGEPHEVAQQATTTYFTYNFDHPFDGRPAIVASYFVRFVRGQVESFGQKGDFDSTRNTRASAPPPPAPPPTEKAAGMSHGTAFAVRPDGVFLTAFHVVQEAKIITIVCANRRYGPATLMATAVSNDLALVRVPAFGVAYLPLAKPRSVRPGDPVFTVGFPAPGILGTAPKFTDGSVSAIAGLANEASLLQVSVPVQPGNSGGPLLNDHGQVVGVITSSAAIRPFLAATGSLPQNINWAVKSEYALPLFDSPAPPVAATGRREAIDRALQATCVVEAAR
jgi:S1-C subfamily serine protease